MSLLKTIKVNVFVIIKISIIEFKQQKYYFLTISIIKKPVNLTKYLNTYLLIFVVT